MTNDLWEHPDWANQKARQGEEDEEGPGLEYVDLDIINDWVVKLTFDKLVGNEIQNFTGNGFFLNVPLNLKVLYNNPFEIDPDSNQVRFLDSSDTKAIIERTVENTEANVHVSETYKGAGMASADYGVICIPRTFKGQRGFGFNIKLANRKTFKGNVHVSGFKNGMMKSLRPLTSSSSNMIYHDNYVEYHAKTEQGISGSPVWVEFKGYPTVVAIHNNGSNPANPKSGSRGALLSVDLLRDVFDWLQPKLLQKNIQIQVRTAPRDRKKLPEAVINHGLFLSFMADTGFGRVRLQTGTKFDCMPVQVDSKRAFYALSVTGPAGEKKWLKFNTTADKYKNAELSETIDGRGCLLLMIQEPNWMHFEVETDVFAEDGSRKMSKLRMECAHIKAYNLNRETSEVSLVEVGGLEDNLDYWKLILKAA